MPDIFFNEGVKPGGLTSNTEIRILLCYILDAVEHPIERQQLEQVLLGEELVNYFAMAESLAQLEQQGLIVTEDGKYRITDIGRTVGRTLAHDVPRSVRDAAVRGVIRAQQYAAKQAAFQSEVAAIDKGFVVNCAINEETGSLFNMALYMPDKLSADAVRVIFTEKGDEVYKLVLAALTGDTRLAKTSLVSLGIEDDAT